MAASNDNERRHRRPDSQLFKRGTKVGWKAKRQKETITYMYSRLHVNVYNHVIRSHCNRSQAKHMADEGGGLTAVVPRASFALDQVNSLYVQSTYLILFAWLPIYIFAFAYLIYVYIYI